MIDRRVFLAGLAALAAARAAGAQPARKVYRIAIFGLGLTSPMVGAQPTWPSTIAFLRGMRELGYTYGEHFVTEPHGAESRSERRSERYPALAAELVRLQMDVIVAPGPMLPALKRATFSEMIGAPLPAWTRSSRAPSPPTCLWSSRQNSNWSST